MLSSALLPSLLLCWWLALLLQEDVVAVGWLVLACLAGRPGACAGGDFVQTGEGVPRTFVCHPSSVTKSPPDTNPEQLRERDGRLRVACVGSWWSRFPDVTGCGATKRGASCILCSAVTLASGVARQLA